MKIPFTQNQIPFPGLVIFCLISFLVSVVSRFGFPNNAAILKEFPDYMKQSSILGVLSFIVLAAIAIYEILARKKAK